MPQDAAAMVVAVVLALGVVGLAFLGRPIPAELSTSLGAAITWLFVRTAQRAEHAQANRLNGKTTESQPLGDSWDDGA
jgi:hypothetical protein